MSIPAQSSIWDDRRNTSRVRPVSPLVFDESMRALARLRVTHPALVEWIENGYPTMTHEQHYERFGEPYKR